MTADEQVGAWLRAVRMKLEYRQDELAAELSCLGWSGSTVAKIEAGTRTLKVTEMLTLLRFTQTPKMPTWLARLADEVGTTLEEDERRHGGAFDVELRAGAAMDVERRAAARLGITPRELEQISRDVWGHGFGRERDQRADGMGRGKTSHVVRQMIDELRPLVEVTR